MNAAHFAELIRLRFADKPRIAMPLEIPCGRGARITVAARYHLRDDGKSFELKRVYTGGLTVIGSVDDPEGLLTDDERMRSVRVRKGWTCETIAVSLSNMYERLGRVMQLQQARAAEREFRHHRAHAVG